MEVTRNHAGLLSRVSAGPRGRVPRRAGPPLLPPSPHACFLLWARGSGRALPPSGVRDRARAAGPGGGPSAPAGVAGARAGASAAAVPAELWDAAGKVCTSARTHGARADAKDLDFKADVGSPGGFRRCGW